MTAKEAREKTDRVIAEKAANASINVIAEIKSEIESAIRREQYSCDVIIPWRTTEYVRIHFEPLGYKVIKIRTQDGEPAMDIVRISW